MNAVKTCLAVAVLLTWTAGKGQCQSTIPIGEYFEYYPDQYVLIDTVTGIAWPAGEGYLAFGGHSGGFNWASKWAGNWYATEPTAAGFTNWRLPTKAELLTAYDHNLIDALRDVALLEGLPRPTYPVPPNPARSAVSWASDKPVKGMAMVVDYVYGTVSYLSAHGVAISFLVVRDTK